MYGQSDKGARNAAIAQAFDNAGWRITGYDAGNLDSLESWRPASWNGFATKQWGPEAWQVWVFGITKSAIPTPGIRARVSTPLLDAVAKLVDSPMMEKASYFVAKAVAKTRHGISLDLWHGGRGLYSHRDHATRQNVDTTPEEVLGWVDAVMARPEPALAAKAFDPNRPIIKLGEGRLPSGVAYVITTGLVDGSVDIAFSAHPGLLVIDNLKKLRFQYSGSRRCWYGQRTSLPAHWYNLSVDGSTDEQRADDHADEVTSMIAERSV